MLPIHSVEITEIYPCTFLLEFRENNVFIRKVTKELFSRNIVLVRVNFSFFPHCGNIHSFVQHCVIIIFVIVQRRFELIEF